MRFIKSKKGIAILATLAVASIGAFGAYAYLTSTGTGSGTAADGSAAALNVTVSPIQGGIVPGVFELVTYKIDNPSTYNVVVSGVTATFSQSNSDCQTDDSGALNNDFAFHSSEPAGTFPLTVAPTVANDVTLTGVIVESNDATYNQNVCLFPNVTTLSLTAS